jgi:hypothetical protein
VYDEASDFDATGKWIPRGDSVSFRISSNVYEANSRGGSSGQVDIVLVSPQGSRYSTVSGPSGAYSLEAIPLTSSLTSTGPVWNTGGVDIGTWTVHAELSMNRIKDNLPDIGEGISAPVEVQIQNVNPLIKSDVAVEVGDKSTPVSATVSPTITPALTPALPVTYGSTPVPQVTSTNQIPPPTQMVTNITPNRTTEPVLTVAPTPVKTPVPKPTQSPFGLLPVFGAVGLLLLYRRS